MWASWNAAPASGMPPAWARCAAALGVREGVPAPHVDPGLVVHSGESRLEESGTGFPGGRDQGVAAGEHLVCPGGVDGEAVDSEYGHG